MSTTHFYEAFSTAVGSLTVVVDANGGVTEIFSSDASERLSQRLGYVCDSTVTADAREQLVQYARGERKEFKLPLAAKGSEFQHRVWDLLLKIPYGETRSYGQLAAILGVPNASRAVGRANATNPIAIVVPCHRVIGSSGALTGYAGGLPTKRRLLELEGAIRPNLIAE